ncbi:hypothetical protein D3C78_1602310 [compost metagenome]
MRRGEDAGQFLYVGGIGAPFTGTVKRPQQPFQKGGVFLCPARLHGQYLFRRIVPDQRARGDDAAGAAQHHGAARRFGGTERIDLAAFQQSRHRLRQGFDNFHVPAEQHAAASE